MSSVQHTERAPQVDLAAWRDRRLGQAHEIRLDRDTIRYHRAGTGPALVFVHGFLSNANLWRKLIPLLEDAFTCITPDWPLGSHVVPMHPDTDLTPHGIANLIAQLIDQLDLGSVTLIGNDSGGAYAQLVAVEHPDRLTRLVLNSCETPRDTWPPAGFGHLHRAARTTSLFRTTFEPLRMPWVWRQPLSYGRLARRPIDSLTMRSYVRPILDDADIRRDARKVIGSVSERYSHLAGEALAAGAFPGSIALIWAQDDPVFPLDHARAYADALHAPLHCIPDSYTYVAEDAPEALADALRLQLKR